MTIVIEDILMTEELDRKALAAVRGGNAVLSCPPPSEHGLPGMPSFPAGFPFIHGFPDLFPREDVGPKVIPI